MLAKQKYGYKTRTTSNEATEAEAAPVLFFDNHRAQLKELHVLLRGLGLQLPKAQHRAVARVGGDHKALRGQAQRVHAARALQTQG